jgi:glyoxylase-like metal-dependent hydrolase (beta-lactamase superfamily II)
LLVLAACATPPEPIPAASASTAPPKALGTVGSAQARQSRAPDQQGVAAEPFKPVQVSPSAWMLQGLSAQGSTQNQNFISNAGFVVTPSGVVVIDALGSPILAVRLLEEIGKITPLPVTHVIVTHYHADHIYGLQVFKAAGARIVAHTKGRGYVGSDAARTRLDASRQELAPWIDSITQVVSADEWLDGAKELVLGGTRLQIKPMGPAHTPEDLVVYLPSEGVLFAGDLVFRGRIPFVGQADSGRWGKALGDMLTLQPKMVVPGHGPASTQAVADMELTRAYLAHLRASMGKAAKAMDPFEDAYEATDWSQFEKVPLFGVLNRMNAYNTYLLMEREGD